LSVLSEQALALAERATDEGIMAHAQVLATVAVAEQVERIAEILDRGYVRVKE
jgi:hypothetical protein